MGYKGYLNLPFDLVPNVRRANHALNDYRCEEDRGGPHFGTTASDLNRTNFPQRRE